MKSAAPAPPSGAVEQAEDIKPNFPADAYVGTSGYYLKYRPPYPDALVRDLVGRLGSASPGTLVDLACGPGRVAFAFQGYFRDVWAVDLEPEMVEAGRREAARRGVANIRWTVGRAEDAALPVDAADLVTLGEAFHRVDQRTVAGSAFRGLRPGGCMATPGSYSVLSGREPWQKIVLGALQRWTAPVQRTSDGLAPRKPGGSPEHNERVLRAAGFTEVASHLFPGTHAWTLEAIVGYLCSTSVASRAVLGRDADAFEADLRAALLAHDPSGVYLEDPQWGYTFGRKPV